MTTLNLSIIETGDDVKEDAGVITAANWPLNIGSWNNSAKHGGFRFQNVTAPQGATISAATLTLPVVTGSASTNFRVYGANLDNIGQWSASILPSGVPKTSSSTPVLTMPASYLNIDVTGIVQEIVNRPGWNSGNSIGLPFIWEGTVGVEYSNFVGISEYSFNAVVATLTINYSLGTSYSFTATPITTSAVFIQTTILSQKHNVSASVVVAQSPTIQNAIVQQKHALIATAPTIGPPIVTSLVIFSNHNLSANALTAEPIIIESSEINQAHSFLANNITTQSTTLESNDIWQIHNLSAINIFSSPFEIERPALTQFGGLIANNLMAQAFIEPAQMFQNQILSADEAILERHFVQSTEIFQTHNILVDGINTGAAFIGPSSIASIYNFDAIDIEARSIVETALLYQNNLLQAQDISTSGMDVSETFILQRHNLIADILITLGVIVGSPNFFLSNERSVTRKTYSTFRKIPIHTPDRSKKYEIN